jgi:hypothetical protein
MVEPHKEKTPRKKYQSSLLNNEKNIDVFKSSKKCHQK